MAKFKELILNFSDEKQIVHKGSVQFIFMEKQKSRLITRQASYCWLCHQLCERGQITKTLKASYFLNYKIREMKLS